MDHRLRAKVGTMRKRSRVLLIAAFMAVSVIPLGFAFSAHSNSSAAGAAQLSAGPVLVSSAVAGPLIGGRTEAPTGIPAVPDPAKLFMVGASLFGLAAAVRKAG
jgi:hypothetical protein